MEERETEEREERKAGGDDELLKKLLLNPESKLYLCKNVKDIKKELTVLGKDVGIEKIRDFILSQKSSSQVINNVSSRRIAEIGRPFFIPPVYFKVFHSDVCHIGRKVFDSKKHLILGLVCALSGYGYIESVKSTDSISIINGFKRILARSELIKSDVKKTIVLDNGVEYTNKMFKKWCSLNKFKLNFVKIRPFRLSKGSGVIEQYWRKVRRVINSLMHEQKIKDFGVLLKKAEKMLNNEGIKILDSMSPYEIVTNQDPRYIVNLRSSKRISRRKYLRKEMFGEKKIDLFSVVRVIMFRNKQKFSKESYGVYSNSLFVVIGYETVNNVHYYKLGYLWTLKPVANVSYSAAELKVTTLSFEEACYKQSLVIKNVKRKLNNGYIEFSNGYLDIVFIGPERML